MTPKEPESFNEDPYPRDERLSAGQLNVGSDAGTGMPAPAGGEPAVSATPQSSGYLSEPSYAAVSSASLQAIPLRPQKRRRMLVVAGIVAAVVIVLSGAALAAYAFWYNNPKKVVSDAVGQLLASTTLANAGIITLQSDANGEPLNVTISFDSKSNNAEVNGAINASFKLTIAGTTREIRGGGMLSSSGTAYFKFDRLAPMLDSYLNDETFRQVISLTPRLEADLKAFINKVDGTWIKVNKEFITQYFKSFDYEKLKQCSQAAYRELQGSGAQKKQLRDVYANNEFLTLTAQDNETIDGAGTNTYGVGVKVGIYYDAMKALAGTDFEKKSSACFRPLLGETAVNEIVKPDDSRIREEQQALDKVRLKMNITQLSHELKRVTVEYDDNESKTSVRAAVSFTQNTPVNVRDPQQSVPIQELESDLRELYGNITGISEATTTGERGERAAIPDLNT